LVTGGFEAPIPAIRPEKDLTRLLAPPLGDTGVSNFVDSAGFIFFFEPNLHSHSSVRSAAQFI
jgi:hypothetical protein